MSLLLDTLRQSAKEKAEDNKEIDEIILDDETLEELSQDEKNKQELASTPEISELRLLEENSDNHTVDAPLKSDEPPANKAMEENAPEGDVSVVNNSDPADPEDAHDAEVITEKNNATTIFSKSQKKNKSRQLLPFHRYTLLALILIPIFILAIAYLYWSSKNGAPAAEENYSPEAEMALLKTPSKNVLQKEEKNLLLSDKGHDLADVQRAAESEELSEKIAPAQNKQPAASAAKKVTSSKDNSAAAPSPIYIKKRKKPSPLIVKLNEAYGALTNGDLDRAAVLYQDVVIAHPKHVHALLALAKISGDQKNTEQAKALYERVLRIDNSNATAQLGLLTTNPRAQKTIDELSRRFPQNANIASAKGAFYADRGEWRVAQEAYFNAFTLQSDNAEFAFNLAVALDHLGKYHVAKQYYRTSIDLVGANHATSDTLYIDTSAIHARIVQLERADD